MIVSYGKNIICKPYQGKKELKSEIRGGVAMITQKSQIVGLKVLKDAKIDGGVVIKAGDTVYLKEDVVYSNKTYHENMSFTTENIEGSYVVVDYNSVLFVEHEAK